MGVKEQILADLVASDRSGELGSVHEALLEIGLSYRGSKGSATLPHFFRRNGEIHDLAAIRVPNRSILSFPSSFWSGRRAALAVLLSRFSQAERVPVEGWYSSSQYSAGQVAVTKTTAPRILELIRGDLRSFVEDHPRFDIATERRQG